MQDSKIIIHMIFSKLKLNDELMMIEREREEEEEEEEQKKNISIPVFY